MLIQFIVENFLSFREETTFNLIPTTDKKHMMHVNKNDKKPHIDILKIAALYGANASGKSNLVKAIKFAKELILSGTRGDETIQTKPFRLESRYIDKPCKFQFLFYQNNRIYDYGFVIDKLKVHEEWLYVKSDRNFKKMYERAITKSGKSKYEFGPSFVNKASKKKYLRYCYEIEGTRSNQLFLSEAFNRNVREVDPIISWFKDVLVILGPESRYPGVGLKAEQDKRFLVFLRQILRIADVGIQNVSTESEQLDIVKHFSNLPPKIAKKIVGEFDKDKNVSGTIIIAGGVDEEHYAISKTKKGELVLVKLKMQHKCKDGKLIDFRQEEESEGTQRLIHLAPAFTDLWENEKVYLIDELDRRLHPNLTKSLIEMYMKNHILKKNRQLIFVTHESNLLSLKLFRRDEIWFTEKNKTGASHLSSLADYKIRSDLNIRNGYLKGRFGAIPLIGDIENLGWT